MSSSRTPLLSLASARPPGGSGSHDEEGLGLRGSLGVVSALDLLQMLCSSRRSCLVRLYGQGVDGDIVIDGGELTRARWGGLFGKPALLEVVACTWGRFDVLAIPRKMAPNLEGSWQAVLLEAAQALDERHRERERQSRSSFPPTASRPPVSLSGRSGEHSLSELFPNRASSEDSESTWPTAPKLSAQLPAALAAPLTVESLLDCGFTALRDGNRAEARRCWLRALTLDPDNRLVQFNLRRLESMTPLGGTR